MNLLESGPAVGQAASFTLGPEERAEGLLSAKQPGPDLPSHVGRESGRGWATSDIWTEAPGSGERSRIGWSPGCPICIGDGGGEPGGGLETGLMG